MILTLGIPNQNKLQASGRQGNQRPTRQAHANEKVVMVMMMMLMCCAC
jgi:hypothetical protein